jgi:hypothetical protein
MPTVDRSWERLSKFLKTVGGVGCLVTLVWSFSLIGYYTAKRPSVASPERGWTVPLAWTHVSYGTPSENEQLMRLHSWFFPFFAVALAGAAIQKLKVG